MASFASPPSHHLRTALSVECAGGLVGGQRTHLLGTVMVCAHAPQRPVLFTTSCSRCGCLRVTSAFACGGLLALAGALLQVLLRNPLADPYVLGISGGAGLGALGAMLAGASAAATPAAFC